MALQSIDRGSVSARYEVLLLEAGDDAPSTKMLTVFKVLDEIIPHLGMYKKVMSLIRKEMVDAVYSDVITSAVETTKATNKTKTTTKKLTNEGERREFLERIPYFTLVRRMKEEEAEALTTQREQVEALKEALFDKSCECDQHLETIQKLEEQIEVLKKQRNNLQKQIGEKTTRCKNLEIEIENLSGEMNRARSAMENVAGETQTKLEEERVKVRELMKFKDGFAAMDAAFSPDRIDAGDADDAPSAAPVPPLAVTPALTPALSPGLAPLPETSSVPVSKRAFLLSNLENCIKIENQVLGVQNAVVAEFDAFLERIKDDVLTTVRTSEDNAVGGIQSIASLTSIAEDSADRQRMKREEQQKFTDSQKEMFLQQKQFRSHMDRILRELQLLRQQKEAVQDQLQAMERARQQRKTTTPGMEPGVDADAGGENREAPATRDGAGEGEEEDDDDEDFMSMDPFVPQEQILNRYAVMVYTSKNNAKTWEETKFGKFCSSCGVKTIVCPHKVVARDRVFPIAKNSTHIRFSRPKVQINKDLVTKVMDEHGISPGIGRMALTPGSLSAAPKTWRKTRSAFWVKPMLNLGTDSHLVQPLTKVFDDFKKRTGNEDRKVPRYLESDHVISLMEQFWAYIIWQDEFSLEDENVNSCLDNLYAFMGDRYLVDDVRDAAAFDLLNSVVERASHHRSLQFLAHIFCGNLDGAAFRYALLLGEFINSVTWTETEDFRRFCRIVYPFLGEDDLENLHMGFMSFCENKVGKIIVWEYMIYVVIKYREPRFQDMEAKLVQHGGQRKESMTDTEFAEAIDQLIPLANEKLRKRLFMEALLSLQQLEGKAAAGEEGVGARTSGTFHRLASGSMAQNKTTTTTTTTKRERSGCPTRNSGRASGQDAGHNAATDAVPVMRLAQISSFLSLANVTTAIRDTIDANIRETRLSGGSRATTATTATTTIMTKVGRSLPRSPSITPYNNNDEDGQGDEDLVFTYSFLRQIAANSSRLKNDDKIRNLLKSESRSAIL